MKRRYFKELRFRQIRALVELKRCGGFAEVARKLQLSVPSVWQQIRALEDEFGVRLAVARGTKVELTDDGRLLAELGEPVVDSFEYLRRTFSEKQKGLKRKLTLATTSTFLTYDLPPLIAIYRKACPEIEIEYIELTSHLARAAFEQGHADIAIVADRDLAKPGRNYHAELINSFPTYLICPPDHPLLKAKHLSLAQIARHPLILTKVGDIRENILRTFAKANLHSIDISMSADSPIHIASYVQMGYGAGLDTVNPGIVSHWEPPAKLGLYLRDVSEFFGKEPIVMLYRASGHEFAHLRAFRETVLDSRGALSKVT